MSGLKSPQKQPLGVRPYSPKVSRSDVGRPLLELSKL